MPINYFTLDGDSALHTAISAHLEPSLKWQLLEFLLSHKCNIDQPGMFNKAIQIQNSLNYPTVASNHAMAFIILDDPQILYNNA